MPQAIGGHENSAVAKAHRWRILAKCKNIGAGNDPCAATLMTSTCPFRKAVY
jgi:hypothetical protein